MTVQSGNYLLATQKLKDSYFEEAIIFMASITPEEGAYGFIINRLSHMPANEVFSGVPKTLWKQTRVFLGGPVSEDEIQVLKIQSDEKSEHEDFSQPALFKNIKDSENFFENLFDKDRSLLFMGYSGWSFEQLAKEIEEDLWDIVSPKDAMLLFKNTPEELQISPKKFLNRFCT